MAGELIFDTTSRGGVRVPSHVLDELEPEGIMGSSEGDRTMKTRRGCETCGCEDLSEDSLTGAMKGRDYPSKEWYVLMKSGHWGYTDGDSKAEAIKNAEKEWGKSHGKVVHCERKTQREASMFRRGDSLIGPMQAEEVDAETGPKEGPPAEVQPLRSRRDYGASKKESGMGCGGCGGQGNNSAGGGPMGQKEPGEWIDVEEVASMCGSCAEKMKKAGIKKIRRAYFMGTVQDVSLKMELAAVRKEGASRGK